jgi:hypothetical protein
MTRKMVLGAILMLSASPALGQDWNSYRAEEIRIGPREPRRRPSIAALRKCLATLRAC